VPRITRLVGVYDADGTVLGELSYVVRHALGRAHCELCDITHGRLREKEGWRTACATLPVPVETFHRDDQPAEVRSAAGGATPVVVAALDDGTWQTLLGRAELTACAGDPDRLVDAVRDRAADLGLAW